MARKNGRYDSDYDLSQYDALELLDELDDCDSEFDIEDRKERNSDQSNDEEKSTQTTQDEALQSEYQEESEENPTPKTYSFYKPQIKGIKDISSSTGNSKTKGKKIPKFATSDTDDELKRLSKLGRNAPDFKLIKDPYEAQEIIKRIHSKNPEESESAKLEMTKRTIPYINSIINEFFPSYRALYDEDLRNTGLEAIFKHCRKFKPEKGKFLPYMSNYIRYEMRNMISLQVHGIPVKQSRTDHRILEKMSLYQQKFGKTPTAIEMSMETGMSVACVERIMRRITTPPMLSLDDDNSKSLASPEGTRTSNPEETMVNKELKSFFDNAIMSLPTVSRQVMVMSYGLYGHEKCKEKEIASFCGIPPAQVRQIQHRALRTIQRNAGLRSVIDTHKEVHKSVGKECVNEIPIDAAEQMMDDIESWENSENE